MNAPGSYYDTCDQIIHSQLPNFFRLYLNPFVAQACYCLSQYVTDTWWKHHPQAPDYPSFLANSRDEALSGAVKLARFCANSRGRSASGIILDPDGQLDNFASIPITETDRIVLIPDLKVLDSRDRSAEALHGVGGRPGFIVLLPDADLEARTNLPALLAMKRRNRVVIIMCVDRLRFARLRSIRPAWVDQLAPDIVVFDETFVHREVPFSAFTAKKALYDYWQKAGFTTFHSTTYQPNTLASLHFLKCLQSDDPDFLSRNAADLQRIQCNPAVCQAYFRKLYNRALGKTIAAVGLGNAQVRAAGHYITVNERPVFDGVAGVACSIRGHNPPHYVQEMRRLEDIGDAGRHLADRLQIMTGLPGMVPAVSGATAVENALKIGLVAQFPKRFVLAFRGGFGGKTLLSLTGTAHPHYKRNLDPLFANVIYVDPFDPHVIDNLETTFQQYPIAIVQLELVQAVGGVRGIPPEVVHYLAAQRQRWGYLLFIDEVQTGMFRTGTFTYGQQFGIVPDLLTIGKGTSDMIFPFALTLFSAAVQNRIDKVPVDLTAALRRKYGYENGYKTVLNVLDRAAEERLPDRVAQSGTLFQRVLTEGLASCKTVRAVRVYGLLIAIELDTAHWPIRWLRAKASWLYMLNMFFHKEFPVLIGFCQYEPHVLKLTPPLTITEAEVQRVCRMLISVLETPFPKLLKPIWRIIKNMYLRRRPSAIANPGIANEPSESQLSRVV